jgi:predicted RNase H-like HicB family nuclease
MNEIGSIVTTGNTLQEAIDANMEIAEQVKGDKVEIHTDKIPKLIEAFKEMESKEIDLTPFE